MKVKAGLYLRKHPLIGDVECPGLYLRKYPLIGDGEEEEAKVTVKKDERGRPYFELPDGSRLFTQEHMNTEIGKARTKAAGDSQALIQQLEDLKAKASTSEAMRSELEEQIEQLKSVSLTKEEQLVQQVKRLENEVKKTADSLSARAEQAERMWREERVTNAIQAATLQHPVFSAEQIHSLLYNKTELKPVIGDDGKQTGQYEVLVTLDVEEEGNMVKKQLPPTEALKAMKGMKDRYGNLFRNEELPGAGGGHRNNTSVISETPPPEALKDMMAYAAWKKANGKG